MGRSAEAMERFLSGAESLREAQLWEPGQVDLPQLPALKKLAQGLRAEGKQVIDQSAGDIADIGEPMSGEFMEWMENSFNTGKDDDGQLLFPRTRTGVYDEHPGHYQQDFPAIRQIVGRSWGLEDGTYEALQANSGRAMIDHLLRGLLEVARQRHGAGKEFCVVMDPLAWSGYRPLVNDLGLRLVYSGTQQGHGMQISAQGVQEAFEFARGQSLTPIGAISIVPSNPTGESISTHNLARAIGAAVGEEVPFLIDAFYSQLAPEGHAASISIHELQTFLTEEQQTYLGLLVGETKVLDSQCKTATAFWMDPDRKDSGTLGKRIMKEARRRLGATNTYPTRQALVGAAALYTFEGGVHAAMGARYKRLEEARRAMVEVFDELELPLTVGGSFYGTAALVDSAGAPLIRDGKGYMITDPKVISQVLLDKGLVGAPGAMFSSAPDAAAMIRLTAAVKPEVIREDLKRVLVGLLEAS